MKHHTQRLTSIQVEIPRIMLEITTNVGCIVNCAFCPQKVLLRAYSSPKRMLDFADFKTALAKTPADTVIIFSGFSEPFLNKQCARMILHSHEQGHPVSVFTTGTGMTEDDVDLIREIPFSSVPHGGFVLHIADNEGLANIRVDADYLNLLRKIRDARIHGLLPVMIRSQHDDTKDVFPPGAVLELPENSRAGYLPGGNPTGGEADGAHQGRVTCGRDEHIYSNVMLPNGDVVLCCQDFGLKHVLGNLLNDPLERIIPAPLAEYALCRSCHYAIALPNNFPRLRFE